MKRLSHYWFTILILLIHVSIVLYFMGILPKDAQIPIHWNAKMEIDGYTSTSNGLWGMLSFNIGMFLFLFLLPLFSPRYKMHKDRFDRIIPHLAGILATNFAAFQVYSLYITIHPNFAPSFSIPMLLIAILFIMLGNLLPKIPSDFFIGIRTPWTLSSERVWYKSHRLGGYCFVIGGLIMGLNSFIPQIPYILTIVAFCIVMLLPIFMSFIWYRQEQKKSM